MTETEARADPAQEPEEESETYEPIWIDEQHDGTKYDPIPYDGNMALTAGLYYIQDYGVYLCTRNTGNPVYNPLPELVDIYVEKLKKG